MGDRYRRFSSWIGEDCNIMCVYSVRERERKRGGFNGLVSPLLGAKGKSVGVGPRFAVGNIFAK